MKSTGTALLFLLLPAFFGPIGMGNAFGATCSAESGPHRAALLELYTSEGCSSCPPADRWLSSLRTRGIGSNRLVVVGFHVDYWNHLGWPDPFAQRAFSERQHAASRRNGARFVYTPQFLLDGKDYRRGQWRDDLEERVTAINREQPGAAIRLETSTASETDIAVTVEVTFPDARLRRNGDLFFAILESGLLSHVTAGENLGRRLQHDFVVRSLAGPFPLADHARFNHRFSVDPAWKREHLSLATFVQDRESGRILQALSSDCANNFSKKQLIKN